MLFLRETPHDLLLLLRLNYLLQAPGSSTSFYNDYLPKFLE